MHRSTRAVRHGVAVLGVILGFAAAVAQERERRDGSGSSFLLDAVYGILQDAAGFIDRAPEESAGLFGDETSGSTAAPPEGATRHAPGREARSVSAERVRRKRSDPKADPTGGRRFASNSGARKKAPDAWRRLSFSSGSFVPRSGLDPALSSSVSERRAEGRSRGYGFLLSNEFLNDETRAELESLGVTVLGPHSSAYKVKFPLDVAMLERVAGLDYVEWVGLADAQLKLSSDLRETRGAIADAPNDLPVMINLFERDPGEDFKRRLESLGATLGKYDPELLAYRAVVPSGVLDEVAGLDFVLCVELLREMGTGHDQSMATMGIDYIRPGGAGARFDGAPIPIGILDTGFMLGGAAAVMHDDLAKWGCGINFSSDAAGVWNDENSHGTHVLGTIVGTGTANARYRGVATGAAESSATAIRAGKVWDSTGTGQSAWMESAMDFMDDAAACGDGARPLVINISGGTSGNNQVGTDSTSRKLDEKVWEFQQLYVACGGNSGPNAGTIWSPGVAKNALAVGNALDNGFLTVGDANNGSSRGPSGDGRMKPNLMGAGTVVTSARAGTTNQYSDKSGCSMATPHLTGLAATLMQHYTEFQSRPYLLRAHLMASAILHDDQTSPGDNTSGGRNDYGLGRASAYVSHWAHFNDDGWSTHWFWGSVSPSNWHFGDITVPAGTDRLVVVLTWDEPAASAGASQAVQNDVDLWIDANADCGTGNCGEFASLSVVDNTEYVIVNNPAPGTYRLKAHNWNVSQTLPVGIAATVVRGDPTPNMTLTGAPSTTTPVLGTTFTVTTSVFNPSYIASGVHLALTSITAGVAFENVRTTREDNVLMDFGAATNFTLGDIHQGDTRSAVWTFRMNTAGNTTIGFRAWSENGGTVFANVAVSEARPDLTFTAFNAPPSAEPGQTIGVDETVGNFGAVSAGPFRVGLYLSSDAFCSTGDTVLGSRIVNGLAVNDASAATTNVTIPIATTLGSRYVCGIVDDLSAVRESNEANNTLADVIDITGSPDLRFVALSAPAAASPGATVVVSDTVTNGGPVVSGAFRVGLYFSNDAVCDTSDTFLNSRMLAGLAPAANDVGYTSVTIPGAAPLGTRYLCAIADDALSVPESNEANNALGRAIDLLSPVPVVNLKVNGFDPIPPIVTTRGPIHLTLDMPPTTFTGTLDWYWALILNGQIYWVTGSGLSTTPAPLVSSPPIPFTDLTLLNAPFPAGTALTSVFLLLDGGSVVSSDFITAVVPLASTTE